MLFRRFPNSVGSTRRTTEVAQACLSMRFFAQTTAGQSVNQTAPTSSTNAQRSGNERAASPKGSSSPSPLPAVRSAPAVVNEGMYCALCDETFEDFLTHSRKKSHQARQAICSAYVVPERHEAIMSQLWDHIQLDFALVDQVNNKKVDRRRMKLAGTIGYLTEQGVLFDSVPIVAADADSGTADNSATSLGYEASPRFPILVSVGESYLLYETHQRLSKLMPKAPAEEVSVIADFLTHPRQIRALFELLQMEAIVANGGTSSGSSSSVGNSSQPAISKSPRLSPNEKVSILLAMLGDMRLFASRERKHTVTDKVVADELVLNVLSNHCCENLVSELVHTTLQRIVDEGTPVWNEHKATLHTHLFASAAANSRNDVLYLSDLPQKAPSKKEAEGSFSTVTSDTLRDVFTSSKSCEGTDPLFKSCDNLFSFLSLPTSSISWQDVLRNSPYEMSPAAGPNATGARAGLHAQTLPRLATRTK